MTTSLDTALGYIHRGWNPVPVPFKTKKPVEEGWQNRVIAEHDAPSHFNGTKQSVGVMMGKTSRGLTDVDLDCAEAIRIAPYVLPKTGAKFGRPSKPDSHWLYYTSLGETFENAALQLLDPKAAKDQKS